MRGGKDSQAPLHLPHPDISGCAVFILFPCEGLPAAVTSPSNTPTSYEGRIPISSARACVLSRILARGQVKLGGGRGAERLLGPHCSRRGRTQSKAQGPERGVSDRKQGHRLQWWFHRDPDPAEEWRKPGWGTAGGGPGLLRALPTVRAALPSRARPGSLPRIQLD